MSTIEKLNEIINQLVFDKESKYQTLYLTKFECEELNETIGVPRDTIMKKLKYAGFDFNIEPNPKSRNI